MRTKLALVAVLAALGFVGTATAAAIGVQDSVLAERKTQAKIAVETTGGMVQSFVDRQIHGDLDKVNAQQQAAALVKTLRYGDSDYCWIQTSTPKMVMHPTKPDLDGTDLSGQTGPDGKHLYVELAAAAKGGGGFVSYLFAKPGSADDLTDLSQKLATLVGGFTTR